MKNKESNCPIVCHLNNNPKRYLTILGLIGLVIVFGFITSVKAELEERGSSPLAPLIALILPEDPVIRGPDLEKEIIPPVGQKEVEKQEEVEIEEVITITHMVNIKTNKGDIKIELFGEDTPITVDNFVTLAKKGFYDGVIFHRVIDGFMIQGGCPKGTGTGGPGHTIPCEFAGYNKNTRGTIAMANAGPNTGGSQFFINLVDNNFLDGKHTVFGRVVEGMEVVDAIGKVETGPGDRPIEDVIIENIEVTEK